MNRLRTMVEEGVWFDVIPFTSELLGYKSFLNYLNAYRTPGEITGRLLARGLISS